MNTDSVPNSPDYPAMSVGQAHKFPGEQPNPKAARGSLNLLGVNYWQTQTADGGDLYLTGFGLPVREFLQPERWYEQQWFAAHRERLPGTSAIFKVPTQRLDGVRLDLVVRFSRVGQEIPLDQSTLCENPNAEFNSPFEEFALVMQLRNVRTSTAEPQILTKTPLAIYSPAEELPLWQSGRKEEKIATKRAQHPEVPLKTSRPYLLLYGWIEGLNATELSDRLGLAGGKRERFLTETTLRVISQLGSHGFRVIDMKPEHIILPEGSGLEALEQELEAYALVDYELLERF
jgi:hypothetical protein